MNASTRVHLTKSADALAEAGRQLAAAALPAFAVGARVQLMAELHEVARRLRNLTTVVTTNLQPEDDAMKAHEDRRAVRRAPEPVPVREKVVGRGVARVVVPRTEGRAHTAPPPPARPARRIQ